MRALLVAAAVGLAASAVGQEGSVWGGVYTIEQAQQGARLFVEHCVACHSTRPGQMSGHGPAPSVIGADFEFRWLDASVADLYDAIRQTMPQGAPNSLGVDEYAALTAYIFELNGYPPGRQMLTIDDYEALTSVWIESRAANPQLPSTAPPD